MNPLSLQDVNQFHVELRNVASAGIPVQLDLIEADNAKSLEGWLNEVESRLSEQLKLGRDLKQAIAEDTSLPASYRSAIETWLVSDRSPVALDSLTSLAIGNQRSRQGLHLALLQPFFLIILGYIALIYITSNTIPKIEAIYQQLGKPPGLGLWIMSWIRSTRLFWICLVPIVFAIGIFYRYMRGPSFKALGFISRDQSLYYLQSAIYSSQLAEWIKATGKSHATDNLKLPPLLSWAVTQNKAINGSPSEEKLRLVAKTYRYLDQMRVEQVQNWLPAIAIGLIGGAIVLAIGLSVFLPTVELLRDLAAPGDK